MNNKIPGGLPKQALGRAFDLSTLKKPATSASTTSGERPGKVVNQQNLVSDFVSASKTKLVILLLWSESSPQSIEIMQTLGKLEAEDKNRWLFGTVNVDQEGAIAQAMQIQSVPVAVAIIAEQFLPLFESVPPADQVRLVINKLFEVAAQKGIGSAEPTVPNPEIKLEPEEEAAYEAMQKRDYRSAKEQYQKWLNRKPGEQIAKIGIAQADLLIRIEPLNPSVVLPKAQANPADAILQMQAADIELAQGELESAFNRLIKTIKTSSGDQKEQVKNHLLQLFTLVDPNDSRLVKARQQLASALF